MACSLDDITKWAESYILSTSYIFRQAAEWILNAGPEIAAASHFRVNIRRPRSKEGGDVLPNELCDKPSRTDFNTSRWNGWKAGLRDIIVEYQDHVKTLDNEKERARLIIAELLKASIGGSQAETEIAAGGLELLIGEHPSDPLYDKHEFPQRHVVAKISHIAYIWLCVLEGFCHWESPTTPEQSDQEQYSSPLEAAKIFLLKLIHEKLLAGPNWDIMKWKLFYSFDSFIDGMNQAA
ncbi:hypothetical protein F5X96DRAFT_691946 [Biscogniauxia mediterranea]|nr:hypothetical protein F5X96DRAFT_691946 [Biscogniauxia mediterranea]